MILLNGNITIRPLICVFNTVMQECISIRMRFSIFYRHQEQFTKQTTKYSTNFLPSSIRKIFFHKNPLKKYFSYQTIKSCHSAAKKFINCKKSHFKLKILISIIKDSTLSEAKTLLWFFLYIFYYIHVVKVSGKKRKMGKNNIFNSQRIEKILFYLFLLQNNQDNLKKNKFIVFYCF